MTMNLAEKKSKYNEKFDELTKLIEEIKTSAEHLADSKDFNIEITKKISESEVKLALMSKDIDRLDGDLDKLDNSIKNLDEQCKELTGSINQIRLSLSDLLNSSERQTQSKKRTFEIFWQILIPVVGAGLLFFLGVAFRSCSKVFQNNNNNKREIVEYKNFDKNK